MKKLSISFLAVVLATIMVPAQSTVKVNQIGYLTGHPKYAWVNDVSLKKIYWLVKRASDNQVVLIDSIAPSDKYDAASGERVTCMDFSRLNTPGSYYLEVEDIGTSYEFIISDKVYNNIWSAGIKSYYYQRSGMDLTPRYAGIWARQATHTHDALLYMGYAQGKIVDGEHRNCSGGWYDAGDFGKKIVPACMALYSFMSMAELYPDKTLQAPVDIPNPWKDLPDLLAEAKWELDWFFTMQEPDGGVHHLIVSPDFYLGPAQNDQLPRYITQVSSTATADFAAAMAMSARVYKSFLPSFADSCLAAARKAWDFMQKHPAMVPVGGIQDPEGIHGTGAYADDDDSGERLWAAAELFRTTGESKYKQYFEDHVSAFRFNYCGWWIDPHNYGIYSWLLATQSGKNQELEKKLRAETRAFADSIRRCIESNGYGSALSPNQYVWGSNSYILNYGMELVIIGNIFDTQDYTKAAMQELNYILGCNALNLCFVSGYGTYGVRDPHQSINSYDDLNQAPPGFVPGGANYMKQDPFLIRLIDDHHPAPAKCYIDRHWSYATNEVCLPYNSGLILLAGCFLEFPDKQK